MVGIGLLTLVPGEIGGSETYARGLTRALAAHGELEYAAFVPAGVETDLPTIEVREYRRARTMRERLVAMTWAAARPGPLRRRIGPVDAMHFPLTIALPPVAAPTAVTLHDTQYRDLPELFSRGELAFRKVFYDRSLRRARLVIVPSEFVRERLGLDKARVVHHGIDHERFAPAPVEREDFLLYPARPWPHKNHARLYEALALLRRERPELRLVLTGGGHDGPVPDGVEVRGLVSEDELVDLYRRAAALVFPSLYEGFGQPPLEAFACGCPVAAARAGSLPEVCGDAARLFDPHAPEEIAAAVAEVLDAPDEWSRRGLVQAARFTWERSARGHDDVYRELRD